MNDYQKFDRHNLYRCFKGNIRDIAFVSSWSGSSRKSALRNNALECLHLLINKTIEDKWWHNLIIGCNQAIKSYEQCSGYAKQWKQLRNRLIELAPSTARFKIVNEEIELKHIPMLLRDMGVVPSELESFIDSFYLAPYTCKGMDVFIFTNCFRGIKLTRGAPYPKVKITLTDHKVNKSIFFKLVRMD